MKAMKTKTMFKVKVVKTNERQVDIFIKKPVFWIFWKWEHQGAILSSQVDNIPVNLYDFPHRSDLSEKVLDHLNDLAKNESKEKAQD